MSESGQNREIWPRTPESRNLAPDPESGRIWAPDPGPRDPRKRPFPGSPGPGFFWPGTPIFLIFSKKRPKSGSVLVDTTETIVAESVLFPRIWDPGSGRFWTPETPILGPRAGPQICPIPARSRIWPELGPLPGIPESGQIPGFRQNRQNRQNRLNRQNRQIAESLFSELKVL